MIETRLGNHIIAKFEDMKQVVYTTDTQFHIQLGKRHGAYESVFVSKGNLQLALDRYDQITLADKSSYKKRLLVADVKKPYVLFRD